ncbi:hypothetical protein, partial [Vibrio vulnificus]|uniref:hypothetical protein n=1 Tax=Vibrio vulnificus TaxID=672 RepID=UPI0039B418E6
AQFGGMSLLALIASTIGGTAPDDLEIWRKVKGTNTGKAPLIQHRTITHVFLLWLVLLAYSGYHLGEGLHWDFLFGYAMGGLMHLVVDFPNPM